MTNLFPALILAKSSSKRLPNKNNLDFGGQPMFMVNVLKCLELFDRVYVSSDSKEMLDLAKSAGAIPILRHVDLCGDVPNIPVYQHSLGAMEKNIRGIIAVQANSPTIEPNVIVLVRKLMEMGIDEVMTCDTDYHVYGSVWAIRKDKLVTYGNPHKPKPSMLVLDRSTDIHTLEDYRLAKQWQ